MARAWGSGILSCWALTIEGTSESRGVGQRVSVFQDRKCGKLESSGSENTQSSS